MKKLISILAVVIAVIVFIAVPVSAASLGVSPSKINIEVPEGSSKSVNFQIHYFSGKLNVSLVDIPLEIEPTVFNITSSPESIVVTFYNAISDPREYSGYVTFLSTGNATVALAVNIPATVKLTANIVVPPTSDGGGNGGAPTYSMKGNLFGETETFYTDYKGTVRRTVKATSQDGNLTVTIPKGTIALGKDNKRLKTLGVAINEDPPAPPDDENIIGLPYDFSPAGATFEPPITFTWAYDPDALPEGAVEGELTLAYYLDGEWVELECVVDTENNIVTASVSHFTTFALMIEMPTPVEVITPTPIPAPTPAPPVPVPAPPVITPTPTPIPSPELPAGPFPPPEAPVPTEKPNYTIPIVISIISFMVLVFAVRSLWYRARGKRNTKYGENSD